MSFKLNVLMLAVMVILFCPIMADLHAEFICGDADGGGFVDIDDAVYLIEHLFAGGPEPDPVESGDADLSGEVDIDDVVYLIDYLFGNGPAPCIGTVTDVDGNVYRTIKIGYQWWMLDNLKTVHYRNGDPIYTEIDGGTWCDLTTGAYCDYDNDPANSEIYGRLYNWYAVDDSRNIAPEGWHVSTDDDWKQLEIYLGMDPDVVDKRGWLGTDEGGKLKEAGTTHWLPPNESATNASGFCALPAGARKSCNDGRFLDMTIYASFWTSTADFENPWVYWLKYSRPNIEHHTEPKEHGFSIRCVKD